MRIVAVNHLHPEEPHIGAVRVARFAGALAERGHRVVLLTGVLDGREVADDPAALAGALAAHDWRRPFHLACRPVRHPLLAAAREGRLPRPLRLPVLAWHYLRHGGVFTDWRAGSIAFWPVLAETFRPEVTWATFGNTDAWNIARGIARRAGCPWVMDIKDVWDAFVPARIAPLVAGRFADAAACTGLSQGHLDRSGSRFPAPRTVIYSGVPDEMLAPAPPQGAPFRIVVAGSAYGWLPAMVEGARRFLERLPETERAGIAFTYAGGEHVLAAREARALAGLCRVDVRRWAPLSELAALQREAFVNVYGRRTGYADWFHHKIFELLCADRPIACVPEESGEALSIAAAAGAAIDVCADADALAAAMGRAWGRRDAPGIGADREVLARYTWAAQAEKLEAVLADAAGRSA